MVEEIIMNSYEKYKKILSSDINGLEEISAYVGLIQDLTVEVEELRVEIAKIKKVNKDLYDEVEKLNATIDKQNDEDIKLI